MVDRSSRVVTLRSKAPAVLSRSASAALAPWVGRRSSAAQSRHATLFAWGSIPPLTMTKTAGYRGRATRDELRRGAEPGRRDQLARLRVPGRCHVAWLRP